MSDIDNPIRVLAIDGGGIRGIIPGTVLRRLEELCGGARIAELFDLIAGTSTGGILALGLTVPGSDGRPRYSAGELQQLYAGEGAEIFPGGGKPTWKQRLLGPSGGKNFFRDLWGASQRAGAPFGGNPLYEGNARYFATGLEEMLARYLGDVPLGSALRDVVVTSYDMSAGTVVLFRSWEYAGQATPLMRDVARATSAGPTYFSPARLTIGGQERVLIDGGVAANNPAMVGLMSAMQRNPGRPAVVVSLGTGTKDRVSPKDATYDAVRSRNWLKVGTGLMHTMMDGTSDLQDRLLLDLLSPQGQPERYWRFQADLGACNFAMDDASTTNVACLRQVGELLAAERDAELRALSALLVQPRNRTER
jgi:patatin-like phospholipase/acyl hydrolase